MVILGKVAVLCGSLSEEAARETEGAGVFTSVLLARLRQNPTLMALPLDLEAWRRTLPDNLLQEHGINILEGSRETIVRSRQEHSHDHQTAMLS